MAEAAFGVAPLDEYLHRGEISETSNNDSNDQIKIEDVSSDVDPGYDGDTESQYPYKIEEPDMSEEENWKYPANHQHEELLAGIQKLKCSSEGVQDIYPDYGEKTGHAWPARLKRTFSESTVSEGELEVANGSRETPPASSKRPLRSKRPVSRSVDGTPEKPLEEEMDVDDGSQAA